MVRVQRLQFPVAGKVRTVQFHRRPGSVSYSPKLPLMGILIPRDAWEGGEGSEREAEAWRLEGFRQVVFSKLLEL